MRTPMFSALVVCALVILGGRRSQTAEPVVEQQLVGTWKLVSVRNGGYPDLFNYGPLSKRETIKHITPTHFMTVAYAENGTVLWASGGSFSLKEDQSTETVEYGVDAFQKPFKGKGSTHKFKVKFGGTNLLLTETTSDVTREEGWERLERK